MQSRLSAVAEYAASFVIADQSAILTARECLIEALACGLEALRDPQCAARIGPIVPGALMPGGARVPGTSLELEPAQAAYCMALMFCGPAAEPSAASGASATASLPAVLAVADYQARKAMMQGTAPPKVRDVLTAMIKAVEIAGALAAAGEHPRTPEEIPLRCTRIAAAAILAAQLGGAPQQIATAIGSACLDGDFPSELQHRQTGGRLDWATAETLSRAVRHACQATAVVRAGAESPAPLADLELAGDRLPGQAGPAATGSLGTGYMARLAAWRNARACVPQTARLLAAVERHFPARQGQRIRALCVPPERLDELPVNEWIAALVANGAR
jgi:2-methylcitrate dehydratase PrpD